MSLIDFAAVLLSFLFPIGIWLGLEGYEIQALILLLIGWIPMSAVVGGYLHKNSRDSPRS